MGFHCLGKIIVAIGVYAPENSKTRNVKDTFEEELRAALEVCGNEDIILLGDFNA